jgi:hypothetical protein
VVTAGEQHPVYWTPKFHPHNVDINDPHHSVVEINPSFPTLRDGTFDLLANAMDLSGIEPPINFMDYKCI